MKIIFRMAVRNMLPETINKAAQQASRPISAEEHSDIRMKKVVQSDSAPHMRDEISVLPQADPRAIESILEGPDEIEVWLEDLDTDEIADEEAVAVEALLVSGWEIDWD
jgi:hypothetical protein